MAELEALRQRRMARPVAQPSEPERTRPASATPPAADPAVTVPMIAGMPKAAAVAQPSEPLPAPTLNRHQRRALAALERRRAA
jgi:hypothetical protein